MDGCAGGFNKSRTEENKEQKATGIQTLPTAAARCLESIG